jgi:hypothetical protein
MKAKSETVTDNKSGAQIEVATIELDGIECTAYGAIIDETNGRVTGYPNGEQLLTWDGKVIEGLKLRVTSSWRTPNSFVSDRMYAYSATYKGNAYHGRGAGDGMVLNLRRNK